MSNPPDPNLAPAAWSVHQGKTDGHSQLAELVMAWAKDSETGEPRYIFELGVERRGASCGCVCYSCGLPLTAVNAAKSSWQIRPHFRHPEGAERNACLVLTARAAALRMLQMEDQVMLPARRVGVPVVGVSGKQYTAWVTKPPERVGIRSFKPQDQVSAILTLDDGRELMVQLTGSLKADIKGAVTPVIQLVVDAPELAALSPEQLKARLHLLVENGSWCGAHWDDAKMTVTARSQAEVMAAEAVDWASEDAIAELNGAISRESLLHWLAKEILFQEKRIRVPAVVFRRPWRGTIPADAQELARREAAMLELSEVRLEKKVGQIRPDVVARYIDPFDGIGGLLFVEVTVTNDISPERLIRIREEGQATLEINIGSLGGALTRLEFARLLTDELAAKKWLHHPWLEEQMAAYQVRIEEQQRLDEIELAETRVRYLRAVETHSTLRTLDLRAPEGREERKQALAVVRDIGGDLVSWSIGGADDDVLFAYQGCILDRLLSIRDNKVVGYRLQTLWQVLNTVLCEKGAYHLEWHTLYLTALKVYAPPLRADHQVKVDDWRAAVLQSLRMGEATYRRSARFDDLLGFLFPEMADDLKKPLPSGEMSPAEAEQHQPGGLEESHVSGRTKSVGSDRLLGRQGQGLWLEGEDLEEWRRQNPEAAKAWDQGKSHR